MSRERATRAAMQDAAAMEQSKRSKQKDIPTQRIRNRVRHEAGGKVFTAAELQMRSETDERKRKAAEDRLKRMNEEPNPLIDDLELDIEVQKPTADAESYKGRQIVETYREAKAREDSERAVRRAMPDTGKYQEAVLEGKKVQASQELGVPVETLDALGHDFDRIKRNAQMIPELHNILDFEWEDVLRGNEPPPRPEPKSFFGRMKKRFSRKPKKLPARVEMYNRINEVREKIGL